MKKIVVLLTTAVLLVTGCTTQKNDSLPKEDVVYENEHYTKYVSLEDIQRDTSSLGGVYKKYYSKYIQYFAPNNKPITIVAQDKVTDEQMLYAYNMLSFYLKDYAGMDKSEIANKIANNKSVLVMPNGADGASDIPNRALKGQPLYQNEVANIGSDWYINNDYEHRDAAFEEILHMVHDYGIGTKSSPGASPELQKNIESAMLNALPEKVDWGTKGLWGLNAREWLLELSKEGSLEQEYLASVVDSYYGLWGAFDEPGGMWGLYTSKSRDDISDNDPMGYTVVESFLPTHISVMARIDPTFEGTFEMEKNDLPYTFKSQYLKNVRLTGGNNSNVNGNDQNNIFMGNLGNNIFDGKSGLDTIQLMGNSYEYKITKQEYKLIVEDLESREGVNTLINMEVLRFMDKDIKIENIN